ncbi:MAG TPA: twin-arginine translocase TatA/TatE family subunit [Capsulimonadaceae bacterium]|nr:twin-arginine translocase TatA/TatE family subunit [Capsulimonadaceae bacterium]
MELAFGFSLPDLAIIFVIALVIFGPQRLPELGKQLGQMMRELRKVTSEFTDVFHDAHADIRQAITITDPPERGYDSSYPLDQDPEEGLMARSPLLAAPQEPEEAADEPAAHGTGLVVSTVPSPHSEGGVS